jgi:hypothetical protein
MAPYRYRSATDNESSLLLCDQVITDADTYGGITVNGTHALRLVWPSHHLESAQVWRVKPFGVTVNRKSDLKRFAGYYLASTDGSGNLYILREQQTAAAK